MLTGILLGLGWFAFVIIILLAMNGWLINQIFFVKECIAVVVDLACQLWIDLSRLWSKPVRLDETEDFYHK